MDTYFIKTENGILDISKLKLIVLAGSSNPYEVQVIFYNANTNYTLFTGTKEECQKYINNIYDQMDEYQRFIKKLWSEGAE